jgi:dTDP-glucose 4,6-dehydratase
VHIGTDEVYGSVETGSSLETDPLEPRSPYSASKAGSDLIALSHFHTHGLPVSVTRCTNNFGPYQFPEKAIPLFATNIFQNKKIPLYGDGLNERDWIDVLDHCAAVHKVLTHGESGQIYNIGAGNGTSNIDLVGMILRYFEQDPAEWIERVQDRKGHDRRYSVDVSKITNLGWKPLHNIEDSLSYTIDWYRSNRWWWEPLKNV